MELEVCFKFQPSGVLKYRQTNMVIMEVKMPSGFVVSSESLNSLTDEEFVARVESKDSETTAFVYFHHLQAEMDENCINLEANKLHAIAMLQPSTIRMYDYYNPKFSDIASYEIRK